MATATLSAMTTRRKRKGEPPAAPLLVCIACGCDQTQSPFVHISRCRFVLSRPTVNAKYAAALFRAMCATRVAT